jgi:hypothetical protein
MRYIRFFIWLVIVEADNRGSGDLPAESTFNGASFVFRRHSERSEESPEVSTAFLAEGILQSLRFFRMTRCTDSKHAPKVLLQNPVRSNRMPESLLCVKLCESVTQRAALNLLLHFQKLKGLNLWIHNR